MYGRGRRRWLRCGAAAGALAATALLVACADEESRDFAPAPTTLATPATSAGAAGGDPPPDGASTVPSLPYTDPQLVVVFEPARRMVLEQTTTVEVTVSVDEDGAVASVVTSETGAATSVAPLGAGCRVDISLVAEPPDAFAFLPTGAQSVDLCGADGPTATRRWAVRPLRAGQPLLGASYVVDGRDGNVVPFRITVESDGAAASSRPASTAGTGGTRAGTADGRSPVALVVGALLAVLAAGTGAAVWWRRRRRPPGTVVAAAGHRPPAPVAGAPRVFLSYAREDQDAVGRIERMLADNGLDPWRDVRDIAGGEDWMATIAGAVGGSAALVLVLSPSCAASEFVPDEVALARKYEIPVVPVRVAGAEEVHPALELAIARAQVVDLRGASWSTGTAQLVQALRAVAARQGPFSLVDPVRRPAPSADS